MKQLKLSLRTRIFISMTVLVLIASVLIAAVTIYQYKEEAEEYHRERLERKEERLQVAIANVLKSTTYVVNEENVVNIFNYKNRIFQISEEHSLPVYLYDLSGNLMISSEARFIKDTVKLAPEILDTLSSTFEKRYMIETEREDQKFLSSYTYISDFKSKPLSILKIP